MKFAAGQCLVMLITIFSGFAHADRLSDLQDSIDDMRIERLERDRQRLWEQEMDRLRNQLQRAASTPLSVPPPSKAHMPAIPKKNQECYLIWTGEGFERLSGKQYGLFTARMNRDDHSIYAEVYLPKSYEEDQAKTEKFIKKQINAINSMCSPK